MVRVRMYIHITLMCCCCVFCFVFCIVKYLHLDTCEINRISYNHDFQTA